MTTTFTGKLTKDELKNIKETIFENYADSGFVEISLFIDTKRKRYLEGLFKKKMHGFTVNNVDIILNMKKYLGKEYRVIIKGLPKPTFIFI